MAEVTRRGIAFCETEEDVKRRAVKEQILAARTPGQIRAAKTAAYRWLGDNLGDTGIRRLIRRLPTSEGWLRTTKGERR